MSDNTAKDIQAGVEEAKLYKTMGLYNEARDLYNKLLETLEPGDAELRSRIEAHLNALPDEVQIKHKAAELNTVAKDEWQNCLGLIKAGLFSEALEQLNQLSKSNSAQASILIRKAECYQNLDNPHEAINHYKEALSLPEMQDKQKQLPVLDHLASCYENIGDIPAAIKILNQVIKIDPDFSMADKHRQRLELLVSEGEKFFGLLKAGKITLNDLESAISSATRKNQGIETILMAEFNVEKDDLGESLSAYYSCPFVTFGEKMGRETPQCLKSITFQHLRDNLFVPVDDSGSTLLVATIDPFDEAKTDIIRTILKTTKIKLAVALKEDIFQFIEYFDSLEAPTAQGEAEEDPFKNLELVDDSALETEETEGEEYTLEENLVVRMAYKIINDAIENQASDIHIETKPGQRGVLIRLRIDGDCRNYRTIPFQYKRYLISRLKILAKLDITEKRRPQDGKIIFKGKAGKVTELRVVTIPTVGGNEDMVLRVLAASGSLPLEKMDLLEDNLQRFKEILKAPYGLIPVVGPTGSGKTTSLHAALGYVKRPEKKIWTIEDPVEIVQDGIRQVQVNNKIGMDFAHVLRAFLRADPDIIMVGETRDQETADIVVEAALTGHLVLTTLHTNSAPETMTRLLGLGIDPQNFGESLLGILAQRLVKRLCPKCCVPYSPDDQEKDLLLQLYGNHPRYPLNQEDLEEATFYKENGCGDCNNSGFKGRMAVHELLIPDFKIKEAINAKISVQDIQQLAMEAGMTTLMQDGIRKVLAGETVLNQVREVCR